MKIAKANPFLKSPQAKAALWVSAKTSSAIEGIRLPFAKKSRAATFPTTQALIDHWKTRPSRSGR